MAKLTKAYPNFDAYIPVAAPKNIGKWVNAVQNYYYQVNKGIDIIKAFNDVTSGWSNMEKKDFSNWFKYYKENNHKKYASDKVAIANASYWESPDAAGYFVPMGQNTPFKKIEEAKEEDTNPFSLDENKKEIIEAQRKKIISRLDSVEKLLRSNDGHIFSGKEFEALIDAVYNLKKKINTVNKISKSTKIYNDMIVREANVLNKNGFISASNYLVKVADEEPKQETPTVGVAPPPAPTTNPIQPVGNVGNIPGGGPGMEPEENREPVKEEIVSPGMTAFLKGLEGDVELDVLEVEDAEVDGLMATAQEVPSIKPTEKAVAPVATKTEVPTTQLDKKPETEVQDTSFDSVIDSAFSKLKVSDVIVKLEDLAKIFKTREIPRQLAIVDMMLDHLGMATFFPSLAEATNKALESNQYIATRVDDILARLRGTLETKDLDLVNKNAPENNPEAVAVREQLQTQKDKEDARKLKRKEMENEALDAVAPEIEVSEDMSKPVETTTEMPAEKQPAPPMVPKG